MRLEVHAFIVLNGVCLIRSLALSEKWSVSGHGCLAKGVSCFYQCGVGAYCRVDDDGSCLSG